MAKIADYIFILVLISLSHVYTNQLKSRVSNELKFTFGKFFYEQLSANTNVDKCIPSKWATVTGGSVASNPKNNFTDINSDLEFILKQLKSGADKVCTFKNDVKSMIEEYLKTYKSSILVQTKSRGILSKASSAAKTVTSTASSASNTVTSKASSAVSSVTSLVNATSKKYEKLGNSVINTCKALGDNYIIVLEDSIPTIVKLWKKVKEMYTSGLLKEVIDDVTLILDCVKQFQTDYNEIKSVLEGIKEKLQKMADYPYIGNAYVAVELICNYTEFVDAFNFLVTAIKATSETNQYGFTGSFIGKLMHAVGKS